MELRTWCNDSCD